MKENEFQLIVQKKPVFHIFDFHACENALPTSAPHVCPQDDHFTSSVKISFTSGALTCWVHPTQAASL